VDAITITNGINDGDEADIDTWTKEREQTTTKKSFMGKLNIPSLKIKPDIQLS
jgi:sortase (surface protein transpeptidase)